MLSLFAFLSYTASALSFIAFAAILSKGQPGSPQSRLLLLAATVNAAWAATIAWQLRFGTVTPATLFVIEIVRSGVWLIFLTSVLSLAGKRLLSPTMKALVYGAPVTVLLLGLWPFGAFSGLSSIPITGNIGLSIIALILLERIYGNADPAVRRPVGYLTLAIAGMFSYDLVMYSSSVILGQIEPGLWSARGAANVAIVPLLLLAAQQSREWRTLTPSLTTYSLP